MSKPMNTACVFSLILFVATSAAAQGSVGVSVEVNRPGVYGRIEIGGAAPPPLVYARPIVVAPSPVVVRQEPVYLYVPPGHQKHWAKHCAQYDACGQSVYFVQERWVRERYERRAAEQAHEHEHAGKKEKKDKKNKKGHGDD
jgi:hypothetical protein